MSHLYLLDTNVFRYWVDGNHKRHAEVLEKIGEWGGAFVFLSTVTVAEVEFGLSLSHGLSKELVGKIRQGLNSFPVLELDRHVAGPYGELRAWLAGRYAPRNRRRLRSLSQLADPVSDLELGIQENDLWLTSQALANDAVLVTMDSMTRIREAAAHIGKDLRLVEW